MTKDCNRPTRAATEVVRNLEAGYEVGQSEIEGVSYVFGRRVRRR